MRGISGLGVVEVEDVALHRRRGPLVPLPPARPALRTAILVDKRALRTLPGAIRCEPGHATSATSATRRTTARGGCNVDRFSFNLWNLGHPQHLPVAKPGLGKAPCIATFELRWGEARQEALPFGPNPAPLLNLALEAANGVAFRRELQLEPPLRTLHRERPRARHRWQGPQQDREGKILQDTAKEGSGKATLFY